MKTKLPILRKIPILFVLGIAAFFVVSCGSYQNSSYYDNDGVYGNYDRNNDEVTNKYSEENLEDGQVYAEKFKGMQAEYQDQYEYFTDVDNYSSETENDTVVTVYNSKYNDSERYASWGENNHDVTINYYNNGWGWNSWYDPYWSWNSWYRPYWGWGWNNPYYGGWYNGYYGRNVVYNNGPRGGRPYYNSNSGRVSGRNNSVNLNRPRNTFSSNPRSTSSQPRTYNNSNTSSPRPRGSNSTPNKNISTPRPRSNNNYSTPRSSNSNYSSPRSSGGSFGGSRGGGSFGGGGRSGGGRGR